MTQDEVLMPEYLNAAYEGDDLYTGDQVRELMKLVAAKEREACAKLVESFQRDHIYTADLAGAIGAIKHKLADAIRARGEE